MKKIMVFLFALVVLHPISFANKDKKEISSKYDRSLQKIFSIQDDIKDIHPFLERLFPVAIVEKNHFYVFDLDSSKTRYVFVKEAPVRMRMPEGIQATFRLDFYGNKPACVIAGKTLDSFEGYIVIFHEFVHCNQMSQHQYTVKKETSPIQKISSPGDLEREMNYPFPYEDSSFSYVYGRFFEALEAWDAAEVWRCREELKRILSQEDFEYMTMQEWKEGLARYIENRIRARFFLPENHSGREKPFDRLTFYEGGARFIELLGEQDPGLLKNMTRLFDKISMKKPE